MRPPRYIICKPEAEPAVSPPASSPSRAPGAAAAASGAAATTATGLAAASSAQLASPAPSTAATTATPGSAASAATSSSTSARVPAWFWLRGTITNPLCDVWMLGCACSLHTQPRQHPPAHQPCQPRLHRRSSRSRRRSPSQATPTLSPSELGTSHTHTQVCHERPTVTTMAVCVRCVCVQPPHRGGKVQDFEGGL